MGGCCCSPCRAESAPNEWLLVIRDGRLHFAQVGASCWTRFGDRVVRFPTTIQRVSFRASQVTREMQGIEVAGFLSWVVYRDDGGPWKAYQNLGMSRDGPSPSANEDLAKLAESIIRSEVANSPIMDVIQKRDRLRERIRSEIQDVVKGWGVWLETVEVTDVKIKSQALFEDLQSEFRQDAHVKAQSIRMQAERAIAERRIRQSTELRQKEAAAESELELERSRLELRRQREEEKIREEQLRIRQRQAEQEHTFALAQLEMKAREQAAALETELDCQKKTIAVEEQMGGSSLELARLRAVQEVYKALPISDVRMVNLGEGQGVERLVSQFAASFRATADATAARGASS